MSQIASQPQVQAELTLRLTQLQTRLASLKLENEEVRTLTRTKWLELRRGANEHDQNVPGGRTCGNPGFGPQVKKTWGATLSTLQDMTVLDDYDVSQSFTHSPSSESVKSSVSDGYLNKPSLAKRRANQQETELFYFTVRPELETIRCRPGRGRSETQAPSFCSSRNSESTWRGATWSPSSKPNMTSSRKPSQRVSLSKSFGHFFPIKDTTL